MTNFIVPKQKSDDDENILASKAFLNLGNILIGLFEEKDIEDELDESIQNYMDISKNLKNCENGLKLATEITNLTVNIKNLQDGYDYDDYYDDFEANKLNEILEGYSKFIMIESDFININLCAEKILEDVRKTVFYKLPSINKVKLAMDEISIHGREYVITVS